MDEQSIFFGALERGTPQERAAWLDEVCGGDEPQKQRILQLLQKHDQANSFLEKPAPGLEETMVPDASGDDLAASLEAGLATAFSVNDAVVLGDANHSVLKMLGNTLNEVPRVSLRDSAAEGENPIARPNSPEMPKSDSDSRYRLDGEIARGGMGAIIKGRDNDLGRDLAIKVLLDSHKDKPEVIQRFVEEAQIGGQLQHPGIAPVYELGQFADQRPFFSMKLVKGETLAKLLDDRQAAADDRGKLIGIFEQICQTMAYAHSRGVIHRDLKPANIMVGAFGEVQVMDWGLAKVLSSGGVADEKKARQTHQGQSIIQTMRSMGSDIPGSFGSIGTDTQMGSVMGTPAYMPPEQALGEIDQMDQRADVFGLGAILCEILTGKPPYVADDGTQVYRMASRGKLDDAFARLEACAADAELIALAKQCLELEPANRPRDASVLAERITAYLESVEQKLRETELAKADALVRAEELRRRQKLAYTAGTAIVATLMIGISVSLWQMARATAAEQLARNEANRATAAEVLARDEAARATLAETLAKAEAVRATAAEKQTAETLVEVAAERDAKELARKDAADISTFLSEVMQSPDPTRDGREIKVVELLDNAAKKLETGLADQPAQRAKLQNTLGLTYHALGLYRQAIPLQEQVRNYCLTTFGPEAPGTLDAMHNLAISYDAAGRLDEALKLKEEVLPLVQKVRGPEHPGTLSAMNNLASSYLAADRKDEALKLSEEVLTLYRKVSGPEHRGTLMAMHNLANSYHDVGRQDEAFQLREEVLTLYRKVLGPEHPDTLLAILNLAGSYLAAGRQDEALKLKEEVLALRRKLLGPEHPDTIMAMHNLAISYHAAGREDEALKLREEVLALRRKVSGPEHPDTLSVMYKLANSYHDAGRLDEALKLNEEVLTLRRKVLGPEHPDTLTAMHNLAGSYRDADRKDEALKLNEEGLTLRRKVSGPEHPGTLTAMHNLATSYRDAGREEEALKLREEVLTLRRKLLGPGHPDTLMAMHNLAISYHAAGREDEALKLREEGLTLRRKVSGPEHPDTLDAMQNLASSYDSADRKDEAEQQIKEALPLFRKVLGPEHPDTLKLAHMMANFYNNLGFELGAGKEDESIMAWRKTLELNPRIKTNAPYYLGVLLQGSGEIDEAFTAYLTAVRNGPMREQALEKIRGILKDPKNLDACLRSVKSKPHLKSVAFTAFATAGHTAEALPLLADASAANPEDTSLATKVAALQVWFGLDDEYAASRKRMLVWAADTEDSAAAERASKLACLRPVEDTETQEAARTLARTTVELGKEDKGFLPWARLALGMAECRNGQYEQAVATLVTAAATVSDINNEATRARIAGTANLYRAMCLFQQGEKDAARALFTATEAKMKPLPADEQNPLADDANHDDLILWLAYREASALNNVHSPL